MSRLIVLALAVLAAAGPVVADEDFLRPEQAFQLTARATSPDTVTLRWKIADGYYLYQEKLRVRSATEGIATAPISWPETLTKQDDFFGEVAIYRDLARVEVPLQRDAGSDDSLTLQVTHQGCANAGLCYPPEQRTLQIRLPPLAAAGVPSATDPQAGMGATSTTATSPRASLVQRLGLGDGNDLLPPEEAYRVAAVAADADRLQVTWEIADGTYLYRDSLRLELEGTADVRLGEISWPAATIKTDTIRPDGEIGDIAVYDAPIEVDVPLLRGSAAAREITLLARYQGCAEQGVCYPPQVQRLLVTLPAATTTADPGAPPPTTTTPSSAPDPQPVSESDRLAAVLAGGNVWGIVALFFGLGLLLSLTPCVFPMIPILSGIIAGQGHTITTRRAFVLSLVYVLAMAGAYTVAGVLAGIFGANLQAAFQNIWILSAFALVFVALALSMFGLYELQMPAALQTRLAELSRRQEGGTLTGVAIMGLLSALIVGPCVAPPLAGALIFIGQTGDALLGGLALFALSLGMGAPLIAVGTTAGKLLPRAGAWMEAVKAVFGVLLLAVAVWLLERVLPGAVTLVLWGLLLICSAVFMGALQPVPSGPNGWMRLRKGIGVALLAYGILMLIGAAAGSQDPLQPLRGLSLAAETETRDTPFKRIKTVGELERELAAARAVGRPVMLDFYADWCVTCKELEHKTFSDPAVRRELERFVLLQADVTANDADDRALLQGRLGLFGPPAIVFYDRHGRELRGYRIVGFKAAPDFLEHLRGANP
jgi:thiol:disulfide interchange protein DsbD